MTNYRLYTTCSCWHNFVGYSVTAVGLESEGIFESDQEAIDHFQARQKDSLIQQAYDKIEYVIIKGGKRFNGTGTKIKKWTWVKAKDTRMLTRTFPGL